MCETKKSVAEIIKTRRSIRKYTGQEISKEILEEIVEAGRWAPTGGNSQTVHFTVITNQALLQELREKVQADFAQMELRDDLYISLQHSIRASQKGNYVYDYNAPALIVVSNAKGYPNAIADSACALQNMMLVATELGIGSCWINQLHWLDESESIRAILEKHGIGENETICGALALGYYEGTYNQNKRTGMKVDWVC